MKVDSQGRIIDFEGVDKEKLLRSTRGVIYEGKIDEYFREVFEDWRKQCKLNINQGLVCMSTLFPMRVLDSIMKKKMYDIEIDYTTGNSFGTERETEMLDNPSSLENAKENLKRIKEHYLKYANKHSSTGEEYKLELLTNHGVRNIHLFWMGYFEKLHGAKIVPDVDEMSFEL